MLIVNRHSSHLYNCPFYPVMKDIFKLLLLCSKGSGKWTWLNTMQPTMDFGDVFTPSFNSAMTPKNILSGFRKTGISACDPSAISIESLMPSQVTEKEDGEITLHLTFYIQLFYFPVVCCLLKSICQVKCNTPCRLFGSLV